MFSYVLKRFPNTSYLHKRKLSLKCKVIGEDKSFAEFLWGMQIFLENAK